MTDAIDVVRALRFDPNPSRSGVVLDEYLAAFSGTASAHPPSATEAVRAIREELPDRAALVFADFVAATINAGGSSTLTSTAVAAAIKHDPHYERIGFLLSAYVAAQTGANAGGGAPAWLPAGAVAFADFSAGHYYAGGTETTLSDMVGENLGFGQFNPANVVASTGLTYGPANDSFPTALGDFASALLAGGAIVLEGVPTADYSFGVEMWNADFSIDHAAYLKGGQASAYSSSDAVDDVASLGTGTCRLAIMVSDTLVSISANGRSVVTCANDGLASFVTLYPEGDGVSITSILRSVTVYAPDAGADLPALSSIA